MDADVVEHPGPRIMPDGTLQAHCIGCTSAVLQMAATARDPPPSSQVEPRRTFWERDRLLRFVKTHCDIDLCRAKQIRPTYAWIVENYSRGEVTKRRTPQEFDRCIRTLRNKVPHLRRWLDKDGEYRLVEARDRTYVHDGWRTISREDRHVEQTPISKRMILVEHVPSD